MNVNSIYPNGFEKTRNCNTFNHKIDKDVKQQALTMLKKNKSIKFVCSELNLQYQTVVNWKSDLSKESY